MFYLCVFRTESVAEKMLTNWFTFLLHRFLKVIDANLSFVHFSFRSLLFSFLPPLLPLLSLIGLVKLFLSGLTVTNQIRAAVNLFMRKEEDWFNPAAAEDFSA